MTCSFLLIQFGIISSGFEPSGRQLDSSLPPPPLLSHQGHASCCAARSFFFFFSSVFCMHGESHIWSAEGERCRPFRAHVVIATHLVGALQESPNQPFPLDIGCSHLDKTFMCTLDLVVRTHCYRCSFWSPVCRAGVP